ncbi:MAG TPA: bifunctional phosphoribosylaminoimidazolecarboxamide formyltransferase/IMP cyclohydrolase [Dehalococcoidia bacterium]|nr:bifunctional phosphoribosylaminoimidazolecarboxamide formyltransferase/IMP cyclohydrolase [Dehalococcoidia bacterium]
MRALLAPYDKTGLIDLARGLVDLGWELIATGGTEKALRDAGLPVRSVADVTGSPEILGGRVKTLHPKLHGGILARRSDPSHAAELAEHGITAIDLVACNLYPFEAATSREGATLEDALENIDIGGPAMLRAAAKNFPDVIPICDPRDYPGVIDALRAGALGIEGRRRLAAKAFQHVALYDTLIASYLRDDASDWPEELTVGLRRRMRLRYGENPHQAGALYEEVGVKGGIVRLKQLHGPELSYNNIMDADAAWRCASDFAQPAIAIIKHNTPCGLATGEELPAVYERALAGDPISAFGGIVACNRTVDGYLGRAMRASVSPSSGQRMRYDVIVAPGYTERALEALTRWRDLRILEVPPEPGMPYDLRRVGGGFLLQEPDRRPDDATLELKVVSKRQPTEEELRDLRFAWRACKHVRSNAIVLAKDNAMVGMGAGQPNRVTSVRLAVERAGERARGSVLASDAFFPFFDGMALAAAAGVTAAIAPGGSVNDAEVIAIADAASMALVWTGGERHFRH